MTPLEHTLENLSLDRLRAWSDNRILRRSQDYVSRVEGLGRIGDDSVAAWVSGTRRYATSVRIRSPDSIAHTCTCPYAWGPCKHALAVLQAAARHVRAGQPILPLGEHSPLLAAIRPSSPATPTAGASSVSGRNTGTHSADTRNDDLAARLRGRPHDELVRLLVDVGQRFPAARRHLKQSLQISTGEIDDLVQALTSEIRTLATRAELAEGAASDMAADFHHVAEQLEALVDAGHADAVVELGTELWIAACAASSDSDRDAAIGDGMSSVLAALPDSSLLAHEQLLWVLERRLEDRRNLLEGSDALLGRRGYPRSAWAEVSKALGAQLQHMPQPDPQNGPAVHSRRLLLDTLLLALNRAGLHTRSLALLEAEADACQCYVALCDALIANGEPERARQWCVRGYGQTAEHAPATAADLLARLYTLARTEARHDVAAAYRALAFFNTPSAASYEALRDAAVDARCWAPVRTTALEYLESGRPVATGWPLPAINLEPSVAGRNRTFPNLGALLDIAIAEERAADVLTLHTRLRDAGQSMPEIDLHAARALATAFPEHALAIWNHLVDTLIAEVRPQAYIQAANVLREMRTTYESLGRRSDWVRRVSDLRSDHAAETGLLRELDGVVAVRAVD